MKQIKIIKTGFLMLLIFGSIGQIFSQTKNVIRIDPEKAYGGNVSQYFDHIEYIPMQTTKESLFGDVNRFWLTDSSIIIADVDTRSTLFFTYTGDYITKIKWLPNTFPDINYDEFNKVLIVYYVNMDDEEKIIKAYYSNRGVPAKSSILKKASYPQGSIILEPGYSVKFNNCNFKNNTEIKDSSFNLIDIFRGDSLYKRMLPYNQKQKMVFCYLVHQLSNDASKYLVQDGSLYMSTPIEHLVYKITKDTVINLFEVIFPSGISYSKNILKVQDPKLLDSIQNISRPMGTIVGLEKIFFRGNKLFLKGNSPFYVFNATSEPTNIYNYIYDTLSGKLVALERLTPDDGSSYLPLFDFNGGLKIRGITYFNGFFYAYLSSLDMFTTMEKTKDKKPKYNAVLQQYFKTQNRKSNPVMVRFKLKD